MATNATGGMGPGEGILDGVNATLSGNGTDSASSAFSLLRDLDFMMLELKLVPMTDVRGKATIRVEVFDGSKSIATEIYSTRIY